MLDATVSFSTVIIQLLRSARNDGPVFSVNLSPYYSLAIFLTTLLLQTISK
jgi:hypothetical protein